MTLTPTPMQEVHDPLLAAARVRLLIKRDDLIHPQMAGNKWRKLKYNLLMARRQRYDTLLTFGGAYSNHIYAVAAAGRVCGFNTIGIIRGEPHDPLNSTLQYASDCGMQLHYVERNAYRDKHEAWFISRLRQRYGRVYILPEGGSNVLALSGCGEIIAELDQDGSVAGYDVVACACGTGATAAGLIAGLGGRKQVLGIAVLNGAEALRREVQRLLAEGEIVDRGNWQINGDFHQGGYARLTPQLVSFVDDFSARTGVPLEYIYTGKLLYGLYALIRDGAFAPGTTIVALHSGGLQGKSSMQARAAALVGRSR